MDITTHISFQKINVKLFVEKFSNHFGLNPLNYNPDGFWYSCNNEWEKNMAVINNKLFKYKVLTNKLKILKIRNLKELDEFTRIFKNHNASNIANIINWDYVYKTYDGLEMCPFLGSKMKYSKLFRYITVVMSNDDKELINKLLFKKTNENLNKILDKMTLETNIEGYEISKKFFRNEMTKLCKDNNKYIYRLWCFGWEISSGVIWKNYKNLILQQFV